ncbi:MAG: hypothetical protein IT337_06875 [Thermomicrobiales bacterium]|nr:hypothetical protein [Thermomicrobiales bacterium]
MRCSLGWALPDELEAARCRATDGVIDCWKMHPERTPLIAVPGSDLGAAQDAETTSIVLAAD